MVCKVVNIEHGFPTADVAITRLSQELRIAKANRIKAIKIIHGYGSTGIGGKIKSAVLRELEKKKRTGFIKFYVKGEEFSRSFVKGQEAVCLCGELKKDMDFGRQNDGITVVIF